MLSIKRHYSKVHFEKFDYRRFSESYYNNIPRFYKYMCLIVRSQTELDLIISKFRDDELRLFISGFTPVIRSYDKSVFHCISVQNLVLDFTVFHHSGELFIEDHVKVINPEYSKIISLCSRYEFECCGDFTACLDYAHVLYEVTADNIANMSLSNTKDITFRPYDEMLVVDVGEFFPNVKRLTIHNDFYHKVTITTSKECSIKVIRGVYIELEFEKHKFINLITLEGYAGGDLKLIPNVTRLNCEYLNDRLYIDRLMKLDHLVILGSKCEIVLETDREINHIDIMYSDIVITGEFTLDVIGGCIKAQFDKTIDKLLSDDCLEIVYEVYTQELFGRSE